MKRNRVKIGDKVTVVLRTYASRIGFDTNVVDTVRVALVKRKTFTINTPVFGGAFFHNQEGKTWARGWHTSAARALQTVVALGSS